MRIARITLLILGLAGCGGVAAIAADTPPQPLVTRSVSPDSPARIDLAPDLFLLRLGEGAYVVSHVFPFRCNSVLVEMRDGTLVFGGTPCTPEATRTLLDWAKREFGERPAVAIDTGYHVDNLGGNAAFLAAGIPVYGSDLTVKLLAERAEQTRKIILGFIPDHESPIYKAHASLQFVPPDHVFPIGEGLTLTFGDEQVRVIYPGPTQAPDKVAIYFPARRLLFGSCMVLAGNRPGNTAEADLARWPDGIRQLMTLPVDAVVPAHGDRFGPDLLQHTLDVLSRHTAPPIPPPAR